MKKLSIYIIAFALTGAAACHCIAENTSKKGIHSLQTVTAEHVGMSSATLSHIDTIVKEGIDAKAYPGCQVLILRDGYTVYDKCFGTYTYENNQKVSSNTIYDLASLSKTTGTLLALMKLYDKGLIKLTDKASQYLPFLRGTNKENITITELLFHESGLPASLPFYSLAIDRNGKLPVVAGGKDNGFTSVNNINQVVGPQYRFKGDWVSKTPSFQFPLQVTDSFFITGKVRDSAMQMIVRTPLRSKTYVYSCVNFILLKEVVESICKMPMDSFLNAEFYRPMQLASMSYLPLRNHNREEIAPTLKKDFLRNGMIQGFVHDPDAAILGGVSGNAGLFSTSHDVALVYQMLLNRGEINGKRYLSEETCRLFTSTTSPSGRRGLGFDKPVTTIPNHSPCCASAPAAVYGHTGYTGTCCWVDPVNNLIFVFLSNRTYPNDSINKLAKMGIRTKIQEVIYQSLKQNNTTQRKNR
ncbi:serine hydrolase domain-containing protein [Parabacteroides sp. FAFU027]|uniref:serine hydrolase domain-containing protein n=1 Tax=Parabacteroides sp. FAFU027 TaxID=2922715 RepID=UPI001FAE7B8A|nr:serine hydrolase [Parabacteroides sp. FAFU027]